MTRLFAAIIGAIVVGSGAHVCHAADFTVPHDTLGCMDAHDYSALLHEAGSVRALNASAASIAARLPLCTVLRTGEVVSIIMGKPGEDAVMISRHVGAPTYWANF